VGINRIIRSKHHSHKDKASHNLFPIVGYLMSRGRQLLDRMIIRRESRLNLNQMESRKSNMYDEFLNQ
jgi:hypothetical protein